jgi:hypothetical protein
MEFIEMKLFVTSLAVFFTLFASAFTVAANDIDIMDLSRRGIKVVSFSGKHMLNTRSLGKYYIAVYGIPSTIDENKFTNDLNGWDTYKNETGTSGEYQYLGYTLNEQPITNDRWFSSAELIGTVFNPNYDLAIWQNITDYQGRAVYPKSEWDIKLVNSPSDVNYIINAPFFDSDHVTRGETPTGETLKTLLPNNQWMTKSYLVTEPTQFEDGVVYLRYTKNGRQDYNTIQIPALPRVDCLMTATSDTKAIERGKTKDVVITIDTSKSYAMMYHEKHPEEIDGREYWAQAGTISSATSGVKSEQGVYRITVPNVSPNTSIHVKATVSSESVRSMHQPHTDTREAVIFVGETVAPPGPAISPAVGTTTDASATGILRAHPRDAERFDVSKGIPATEMLYAQVDGRNYLIRQEFNRVSGTIPYTVTVAHPDAVSGDPTTTTHTIHRSYSYWEISRLEVYALESATLQSKALPEGSLRMTPSLAYRAPEVSVYHRVDDLLTHHVSTGSRDRSVSLSSSDPSAIQAAAQGAVSTLSVRNDKLIIDGKTVLSDAPSLGSGPSPDPAVPGMLSRDALFQPNLMIPETLVNGTYPSTGTIRYARMPGSSVNAGAQSIIEVPVQDANAVVVHTPVVMTADFVSDDAHNQNVQPLASDGSIVLGRPFVVRVSDTGAHMSQPGYGHRDYGSYVEKRQIRLSFDAYHGALYTGRFLQAGVWHDLDLLSSTSSPALTFGSGDSSGDSSGGNTGGGSGGIPGGGTAGVRGAGVLYELKAPVWAQLGTHTIEVRTLAVNDAYSGSRVREVDARKSAHRLALNGGLPRHSVQPGGGASGETLTGSLIAGQSSNLDMAHHAVSVTIPVSITGRLYDFRITDITDPMWETFFRVGKGSSLPTGKALDTGSRNINGDADSNRKYLLPVLPGKNDVQGYQDRAVKLGYSVQFEVKSVGPFFEEQDVIRIHPAFYHLDKNGQNRQSVDLYYSLPDKPLIRVGSEEDTLIRKGGISLKWRSLQQSELLSTGSTLWELQGDTAGIGKGGFAEAFSRQAQAGSDMFRTWRVLMGQTTRLFRGPVASAGGVVSLPSTVDPALAHASMQRWFGEWSLPPDTLIVPAGTDLSALGRLTPQHPVFLKEGYLVANFRNMELIRRGDYQNPLLLYGGRAGAVDSVSGGNRSQNVDDFSTLPAAAVDQGNGWLLEGYSVRQGMWDLREGDAVLFYANRRSTDDLMGLGTH